MLFFRESHLSSSVQKLNFDWRAFDLDLTCNTKQPLSV